MRGTEMTLPMRSRAVELRPPSNQYLDMVFHLACLAQVPWEWRDRRVTAEGFRGSLFSDLLAMFAIVDRRSGQEVALLRAFDFHPMHRFVHVSTTICPAWQGRVWPLEGVVLFANYLFTRFDLRHIYGRATEAELAVFRSGVGRYFEVEANLRGHFIVDGEPQDLFILTLSKELWEKEGVPLLDRITAPAPLSARE